MPDVPEEIDRQLEALSDQFMAAQTVNDMPGMEQALRDSWNIMPEPKHEWSDSQILCNQLIGFLRDHGKAEEALALSDEQFSSGALQDYHDEPWIIRGATLLALGRVDESRAMLEDVLKRFSTRAFVGHDERLLTFAQTGEVPTDMFTGSSTAGSVSELPSEMDDALHDQIVVLSEAGDERQLAGDWQGAVAAWREAIALVPEPKTLWDASTWLYGSVGDALTEAALTTADETQSVFLLADARDALVEAMASPGGTGNPLVLMRRGQVELELGNDESAREYLLQAYMLDGEAVFEGEDGKYLGVLRAAGDIS